MSSPSEMKWIKNVRVKDFDVQIFLKNQKFRIRETWNVRDSNLTFHRRPSVVKRRKVIEKTEIGLGDSGLVGSPWQQQIARDERERSRPIIQPSLDIWSPSITCVCVCLLAYSVMILEMRNFTVKCDFWIWRGLQSTSPPDNRLLAAQRRLHFVIFSLVDKSTTTKSNSRPRPIGRREMPDVTKSFDFPPTRFQPFHPADVNISKGKWKLLIWFWFWFWFRDWPGAPPSSESLGPKYFPRSPARNDQLRANGICHVSKRKLLLLLAHFLGDCS